MPHIINEVKLDFKDVLLRPKRSTLKSRNDVSKILIILIISCFEAEFLVDKQKLGCLIAVNKF